jgi:tetratricopeptide (TPR) repeat protein
MNITKETILDYFREPFFWNIFKAHKENRFSELWNLFEKYNTHYTKYGQSKWHSEILNLAERFMKENDEWRFLIFFKNWNPENFRNEDWKETIKDENTYKPLAIKSIKKAFDILKTNNSDQNLTWLIKPYEEAIRLFPNDEWLLREKALLHFKNNELELAINIYKHLVLELGDKHYVWQEFSSCIISDNPVRIGMLSKALSLEKNEDFLGDIHLELARVLLDEGLFDNAFTELETYRKHRQAKGWKLSSVFDELYKKVQINQQGLIDNLELYRKFMPIAESFAYSTIDWSEVVLIDKWKDVKGKDRLTFSNGKNIEFVISKKRFHVLKNLELGQILRFKLHRKENKYLPLIAELSEKKPWEILEDTFAVVDYINVDKNIVHAITSENNEVFFSQIQPALVIDDFIVAKKIEKRVKEEKRIELNQINKVDKHLALSKFPSKIAVVDGVNEQKQLFHFVISSRLQGLVKYSETDLRPKEGDFLKISFVYKVSSDRKVRLKVLGLEKTDESNSDLVKEIRGMLELKYKNDTYEDHPDFGFINNHYVPKYLLMKYNISFDCRITAVVVYAGDKWKVIDLKDEEPLIRLVKSDNA